MKHVCLLLLLLNLVVSPLAAAKVVSLSITYEYKSNDRKESQEDAEKRAIERAKQKALEDKFGVDVSNIIVQVERSNDAGKSHSYSDDFFSMGGTSSRGEWLQTTKEEVLTSIHDGELWHVKVYVEGTGRERVGEPIDIKAEFINSPAEKRGRTTFYDGNDLFLRFQSPVAGALCVYLVDGNKDAYCLLPYMSSSTGCQTIEANKEYLFFSSVADVSADEYTLNTQLEQEQNILYVVFSPNRFTKANDTQGGQNWREEQLPRTLKYEPFLRWLSANQIKDEQMVVRTEVVTIVK
ncbi:MAG: DUF4384 domain-containing protein [Paludibacteraceae bacterium]|nr:DUF4384 domain-containing protein [Paludibacteraceae bacterium]